MKKLPVISNTEMTLKDEVLAVSMELRTLLNRIEFMLNEQELELSPSLVTCPFKWLNEGRIDLQKGFMCVIRAIDQPTTF